jgi:hypothetical protein
MVFGKGSANAIACGALQAPAHVLLHHILDIDYENR